MSYISLTNATALFAKRKQLSFLPADIFANNSFFADEPNILWNSNYRLATCTAGLNFLRTDLFNPCKKFSNGKHDILLRERPQGSQSSGT